ncbi:hypothetical protein A2454_00515 [Candidatus Peribacteria bacterium RIFOXYC2_FULL_55_14]|nr:MAG: Microtubule/TRAF3 and DISC1 binding protein [Candidatus Peribacteria bacterium GW2011_GWB1_54_5]KKW40400.1 MAG: Microtubule/TRAF3 and DISC1 binding protein [Candidatus Peribacteria bacterium GW2011_GWC2_54_8]KKW42171.1 MAG: Microtubule/TRAF3 and DISC1 binding protein [Candidatus Peregrinibacteria bacterium GW2011_GWA2_54_9]OGJ71531.1 MAG: hypothetical protein A2198_04990 [Candidatus Peribacteria bacterium RIFOXYA1_FULL_56_14]OGJ72924.1 MAG: hypothetical protein A2217_06500 [Candidatus P
MGIRDDDEDLFISRSGEGAFQNPEQAKREARERKAKSKGKLLNLKKFLLMRQVGKNQSPASAEADAEAKRLQQSRQEEKKTETFGTKTHMQMEEENTLDAQEKFSSEEMQREEQKAEAQKKQSEQEYASDDA